MSEADSTPTDTPLYMSVYFVFGVATLAIMVLRSTSVVLGTVAAARSLHRDLLHKVTPDAVAGPTRDAQHQTSFMLLLVWQARIFAILTEFMCQAA